ncbi:hypothetical protein, partial [Plasmodium yoelii yoelii]
NELFYPYIHNIYNIIKTFNLLHFFLSY